MREQFIQILARVLTNNIGNTLTAELATGIATVLNQALLAAEGGEVAVAGDETEPTKSV